MIISFALAAPLPARKFSIKIFASFKNIYKIYDGSEWKFR